MSNLLMDLRWAIRMLFRSPVFTLVAAIALALGIGANSAIFSVINGVLLRPLPLNDSNRLVLLWERTRQLSTMMVAYPDFLDWRAENQSFEDIAAFNQFRNMNLTGADRPERVPTAFVTSNFLDVLGTQPALGRGFSPEDDRRGADRTVVLNYGFWQRRFGGETAVVGTSIMLDGQSYTVIGVMPQGIQYPTSCEALVPFGLFLDESVLSRQNHPGLLGIARLKPGISVSQARHEMEAIAKQLEEQHPDSNADVGVSVRPIHEVVVGDISTTLFVLFGAVAFVLLIACANVANLLLARASVRRKEIAIRAALGAGRRRLIRQFLTESLLLSLLGGGLGLLLAVWGTGALRSVGPGNIPRSGEIKIDKWVLSFTVVVSVLTGLIFGLAPALMASKTDLNDALKEAGRGSRGQGGRFRSSLVVTELALALILLAGAGLMVRSFIRLLDVSPGFNPESIVTMNIALPPAKYATGPPATSFFRQLIEREQAVPGVQYVAYVDPLPFTSGGWQTSVVAEGQPAPAPGETPLINASVVSPDFFRVLEIPLINGRYFTDHDDDKSLRTVIVNQSFARRFWPGEDAVGKQIKIGGHDSKSPWLQVVGVVGDVKRLGLETESRAEIHLPYLQRDLRALTLVARTSCDPMSLVQALRGEVLAIDKDQPIYGIRTMHQLVANSISSRKFSMMLFAVFAGVALVLAGIGIYGVISYSVTQRTNEIGLRMALGASPREVVRLVVGHAVMLAMLGIGIGVAASLALGKVISSLLFQVSATDPLILVLVSLLLMGVALAASFIPARRATKVDPMVALRYE